jgi:hypothetical protein
MKTKTVGIFLTPYLAANSWFASTSTFPITTFRTRCLIQSMIGPTILQGPLLLKNQPSPVYLISNYFFKVASVIANAIIFYLKFMV